MDLRLSQEVPLYVTAKFGAGQAELDLGSLRYATCRWRWRGQTRHGPARRPQARLQRPHPRGRGRSHLRLPSSAGVYAEASGGIGSIEAPNLHRVEGHWVNDAYEHAKVRIHVTVHGGVGSIRLIGSRRQHLVFAPRTPGPEPGISDILVFNSAAAIVGAAAPLRHMQPNLEWRSGHGLPERGRKHGARSDSTESRRTGISNTLRFLQFSAPACWWAATSNWIQEVRLEFCREARLEVNGA